MAQYLPNNKDIGDYADGFDIIPARSTTASEPDYILPTGDCTVIRTYLTYSGTVSACDVQMWSYVSGVWFEGPTVEDALGLTNEFRDWLVYPGTKVGFTVAAISGGGTVAVRAEGFVDGTA